MRTLFLTGVALAALSQAALASSNPNGILAFILTGGFPEAVVLDADPFKTVMFDGAEFNLGTVTLAEINDQFGGNFQSSTADNGAPQTWLCYDAGGLRTWFYSGLTDNSGKPLVNLIVEEQATTPAADGRCTVVTAALTPQNDLPGVGATLADLETRFGAEHVKPDQNGHLNFTYQGEEKPDVVQNVFYILKNGVVTSIAFSEFHLSDGDTV